MRLLATLRYRVIPLDELAAALREGRPLPRRAVVMTIDDGYRDNYEIAFPVLRRRGFPADVFLVSERLDAGNDWDAEGDVAGRPTLTREQVERMREGGVRFGAHTRTHRALTEAAEAELAAQLRGSREDLEATLGESVETLTYPYGLHDDRVVEAARRGRLHRRLHDPGRSRPPWRRPAAHPAHRDRAAPTPCCASCASSGSVAIDPPPRSYAVCRLGR